jgi:hypothetical protein
MLFLYNPSHPYFLPLVEGTKVMQPHPFGKLLYGEFCLLQADWGLRLRPYPSPVNRHSLNLHCIGHRKSLVMRANQEFLQHPAFAVPQLAETGSS